MVFSKKHAGKFQEKGDSSPSTSNQHTAIDPEKALESDPYEHLPESEAAIVRSQIFSPPETASFVQLFRYATLLDKALLSAAAIASIASGVMRPLMTVVWGSIAQSFTTGPAANPNEFQHSVNNKVVDLVYIGIADFVCTYVSMFIFIDRGEVLTSRIRKAYLSAILRQNIAYFDTVGSGEVISHMTADMVLIQDSISEKIALSLSGISTFIAAFVVGFVKSWKLTLIMMSIVITMLLVLPLLTRIVARYAKLTMLGYAGSGKVAEEVLSCVRTVQAFGMQERLAEEYDQHLAVTEKWGCRQGAAMALITGTVYFIMYSNYALGFWQGSRFIVSNDIGVSSIISVMTSMLLGALSLGQTTPNIRRIANGIMAAGKIFATIDRQSCIDSSSPDGASLDTISGEIDFKDIRFRYPTRPEASILHNFNLHVSAGETIALVGSSGSGKSTVVGLLQRFYLPTGGNLFLDKQDISQLNIRWLRSQISVVSQEPTLFGCSIFENIAFGLIGTSNENASVDIQRCLVEKACNEANCMSFIAKFPDGIDTLVGDRGVLLSGGQKQRIAIARAIVGNPKILILDEATSALDTESEEVVQSALDRAAKERTTIVIAHRLSTIKDADKIIVMSKGEIVEQGTHHELMALNGIYFNLVQSQQMQQSKSTEIEEKDDYQTAVDLVRTMSLVHEKEDVEGNDINDTRLYGFWKCAGWIARESCPELRVVLVGIMFASITGLSNPIQAVFFAKCVSSFEFTHINYGEMRHTVNMYSGLFFMLAVVEGIAFTMSGAYLVYASQHLVRRARLIMFRHYLRQDIAFHDCPANSPSALSSTLSTEAQQLEGLTGTTFGQIVYTSVTLAAGMILSLCIGWKLALVCIACMPILIGCGAGRVYVMTHMQATAKQAYLESADSACEAIRDVRTVAALNRENQVQEEYFDGISSQVTKNRVVSVHSAGLYALCQAMLFWILALAFWYGSTLLVKKEYSIFQFFISLMAIITGTQSAGQVFSYAPDMAKAKEAAESIMNLTAQKPVIDTWNESGIFPREVKGNIEFANVYFRYPSRPDIPILRSLSFSIKQGQFAAFVGSSGCGKSTTLGLLEQFYRLDSGQILLDGQDISAFNINKYRNLIGLVQQEPALFSGSIRYNLHLGTSEAITDEEMHDACKQANIHDFIMSLPDGYDTLCGAKGTLLSGGQKQRIAIARAILRKPRILLLDEATSALDSESEKVVQDALDKAAKGRTTIAVAHRLSTIQNADVIFVFENGRVLEYGTHQQLLANKSRYHELVKLQALENK
ncbi:P-loop containing nucleoside triphosphate hydrolase protein [Lipomyces tetrasporus]|uniref:P-loop containing nucleoside triphosphate hydrolase protein n=1 Tax=Lipomyces tetrasporus TaxID=54092 RepID=A0AAD7VRR7_9ASCO|nr:P-loop containing nucleoside triphosphate hydrolase protein [Lipomyces tetrasporus]KAJ8098949.1 P-loop containing nucleoside triphosphate hydrolase protein [Lipomyces tetrasporus]